MTTEQYSRLEPERAQQLHLLKTATDIGARIAFAEQSKWTIKMNYIVGFFKRMWHFLSEVVLWECALRLFIFF